MTDELICLAEITGVHGIRGDVRLRCFTQEPESVDQYGALVDEKGLNPCQVTVLRRAGPGQVIAHITGMDDRTVALAQKGRRLYVPRARLPAPEPDSFYHADLIGLAVQDQAGAAYGQVMSVQDFGAGPVLEIKTDPKAPTLWLPFRAPFIVDVQVSQKILIIDPPILVDAPPPASGDEP